jgi:methyl-accepting chemotaxis protein
MLKLPRGPWPQTRLRFTLRLKLFLSFTIICGLFLFLGQTAQKALRSSSLSVDQVLTITKAVSLADAGKINLAKAGQLPKIIEVSTTGIDDLGQQATTLDTRFHEIGKQLTELVPGEKGRQLTQNFIAISSEYYTALNAFLPIRKKMLSYTADYQGRNRPLPDIINERELGHVRFIRTIKDSIDKSARLTGGLDTAGCGFYQWYSQTKFEDEDISEVFEEIHPLHDKLHKYARQIDDKIAANDLDGAREIFVSAEKDLKTLGLFFAGLGKLVEEKFRAQQGKFDKQLIAIDEIYSRAEAAATALQTHLHEDVLTASLTEMNAVTTASNERMMLIAAIGLALSVIIAIYAGFMMGRFIKVLRQVTNRLTESATLFIAMSEQLFANASQTQVMLDNTNRNIEQTTENISSLAASSEEINAAIYEISSNTVNSAGIAKEATDESKRAAAVVETLKGHADSIGHVSKTISAIAFQTKLLALNANVEAARAGEAGAGFAIVANEVKNLAQAADSAATEINQKIATIQEGTRRTAEVMANIGDIVIKISDNSSAIAASVEEESSVVAEISSRINDVSGLAQEVASHIHEVADAATDTRERSLALQNQAELLGADAGELETVLLQL